MIIYVIIISYIFALLNYFNKLKFIIDKFRPREYNALRYIFCLGG